MSNLIQALAKKTGNQRKRKIQIPAAMTSGRARSSAENQISSTNSLRQEENMSQQRKHLRLSPQKEKNSFLALVLTTLKWTTWPFHMARKGAEPNFKQVKSLFIL